MGIKLVTPEGRISFPHIFSPKERDGQASKYECALIIDKSNAADLISRYKRAVDALIAEKWPDESKRPKKYKQPLKDGDKAEDSGGNLLKEKYASYEGAYILTARGVNKPGIVDASGQPIIDPEEVYGGCYGRISVDLYAYHHSTGGPGIGCGLNHVLKTKDGDRFGADRSKAEDDFSDFLEGSSGSANVEAADDFL